MKTREGRQNVLKLQHNVEELDAEFFLKKIVLPENKGVKVLCEVEGKRIYITKESHLGGQASSQEPDALDQW